MSELALLERPNLIDELCEHQASGEGLVAWCAKAGIRYSMIRAWIEADSTRMHRFEQAERHRADLSAAAIEAMARKLLDPAAETGHPWVDRHPIFDDQGKEVEREIDPRAARAALDALKWGAMTNAPKRYGRSVDHVHTHRIADDHLIALRSMVQGGPGARNPALAPPPDIQNVDFRVLAEPAAAAAERLVPVVEVLVPDPVPSGGCARFSRYAAQFPRQRSFPD